MRLKFLTNKGALAIRKALEVAGNVVIEKTPFCLKIHMTPQNSDCLR